MIEQISLRYHNVLTMQKLSTPPVLSADFFDANRRKLKSSAGDNLPIVITGNSLIQKSADTAFPFKQDNNFWYLTGIDQPGMILVIDDVSEYIILPINNRMRDTFDGKIDKEHLKSLSGISNFLSHEDGWEKLRNSLKKSEHVATLEPTDPYIEALGMFSNPARQKLVDELRDINKSIKLHNLQKTFAEMRSIKTAKELAIIEFAITNTENLLADIHDNIAQYKHEREISAKIRQFAELGGFGLGYEPIVAGGANANTLHYEKNNQALAPGVPVLLDVGLSWNHYSADITRTFSSTPSKRYLQVHEAVLSVYDFALGKLKPGVLLANYEGEVAEYMGDKLVELGLISEPTKENIRRFYPHSTSHFLGLDVHDTGNYKEPLAEGMVLTVEPGIYIQDEGLGIRYENNIVITSDGSRVLGGERI